MEILDKTDLQILRVLQNNSRLTNKELAAQVNLSPTPVFERVKRLEANGYIRKYVAVLDPDKLNRGFVVFCSVKLSRLNRDIAAEFTRIVREIPEVTECYNISGNYDYLLKIHAPDMKYYQEFIINVLGTIFNVEAYEGKNVVTTLVKGSVKIGNQGHDVLLKPGEQAQVESPTSRPEIRTVNTSLYTSWVTGVFHFKDTTLGDIAQLLSRWYDVDIRCAGTHVADIRLAGSIYRNRELGYTLELLQHVGRLTFRKQADGSILIQEKQSSNHN